MKKIIKKYAIETFGLWVITQVASGIIFKEGLQTLFIAGAALTAASLVAKPVINLLLLPLNMVTFNLFKWVSSAVVLYLVALVIPNFNIERFVFTGFSSRWIDIPSLQFEGLLAYIGFAFILSVVVGLISWIMK